MGDNTKPEQSFENSLEMPTDTQKRHRKKKTRNILKQK